MTEKLASPTVDPTLSAPTTADGEEVHYGAEHVGQAVLESAGVSPELNTEMSQPNESVIFEHIPPELESRIEVHLGAKQSARAELRAEIGSLKEELSSGLMSKWVDKGSMKTRTLVKDEVELEKSLKEAAEEYKETEAGQREIRIKELREFLANPTLTKVDLAKAGSMVGSSVGKRKLKLVPGHAKKVEEALRYKVERELNTLVPVGGSLYDDEERDWKDAQADEATIKATIAIDTVQREASSGYEDELRKFQDIYRNAYSTRRAPETGLDKLHRDVEVVDKAHSDSAEGLKAGITSNEELLALIVRGSLSPKDVVTGLKDRDRSDSTSIRGMFEEYITTNWIKSTSRLAEPSLAGMKITEQDVNAEGECLNEIAELAKLCGVQTIDTVDRAKEQMQTDIQRTQKLFHSRIDTPNSLYWHFSKQGLGIISSGELQAGGGESGHNTGDWSKGVHFVKPGFGIDTSIGYHSFAKGIRTNAGQPIADALGVAIIYKLGDLIERTPYRDEPLTETYKGKGNVSEDVTFRDENEGSDYEYTLDDAYILPLADWKQLSHLRDEGRYSDVFVPGKPITRMAYEIAERALRDAGRSDEWITAHLLPSEGLVDPEMLNDFAIKQGTETKLFNDVMRRILSHTKEDTMFIVPVTAKKGTVEAHDAVHGIAPELWQEELGMIDVAKL